MKVRQVLTVLSLFGLHSELRFTYSKKQLNIACVLTSFCVIFFSSCSDTSLALVGRNLLGCNNHTLSANNRCYLFKVAFIPIFGLYSTFKNNFAPSIYLDITRKNCNRKTLVKLRIGNHKLEFETGRYDNTPRCEPETLQSL